MNALILTKAGDNHDEGMKNYGMNLAKHLRVYNGLEVRIFDTQNITERENLETIVQKWPDIIHLVVGPTTRGLTFLKLIGKVCNSATVCSCLHPSLRYYGRPIIPDVLLVQSKKHERKYGGKNSHFLPVGVDTSKFSPGKPSQEMRNQFNVDDEPVFLHVGHIKKGRGVHRLTKLTKYGKVHIIGSPSTNPDMDLARNLEAEGCEVWTEYFENIEEIYRLADLYIFPTTSEEHCIQLPLSVFEAMSCNIPVISTRFGGLPDLFQDGAGIKFINDMDSVDRELISEVKQMEQVRSNVVDYDWGKIAESVSKTYKEVVAQPE